jgi:hypothetical protein
MEKTCPVCFARFDTATSQQICSEECRAVRLSERQSSIKAKFQNLERVLESEKVFWRDDRLIRSPKFYAGLLDWQECVWCGGPLSGSGHNLDRIDNSKPHYSWNVTVACGDCNRTRGDIFTFEEFTLLRDGLVEIRKRREAKSGL